MTPPAGVSWRLILAVLLSLSVIGTIFAALSFIDVPLAKFLRAVHLPLLEQIGDIGMRLGSGAVLVLLSVALLLVGLAGRRPTWRLAGLQSLLAHGVAALITQALKHLVGRPRPRFLHTDGGFAWWPSLATGLDSFPSGHATASFAVATVLARRFSRLGWLVYGAATFVAATRVVRGSHFPTDILAGMCIGVVVGAVLGDPLSRWKTSVVQAILTIPVPLIVLFTMLWVGVHAPGPSSRHGLSTVGLFLVVAGLGLRLQGRLRQEAAALPYANGAVAFGLALLTESPLIVALTAMLCAMYALGPTPISLEESSPSSRDGGEEWHMMRELGLIAGVLLAALMIQALSGALPILQ